MRLWPQKRRKKILLTAFLIVLALLVGVTGYFEWSVYREVETETQVLNANGAKTAIMIYHPGLTDFAQNITYTYAEALETRGWRVEIATASSKAPTDLNGYSLLVLCWPIYDLNSGPTITNHLHRIGNLNGIDTVIITISGGLDPLNAKGTMNKIVENANGNIVQSLFSSRSNRNLDDLREEAAKLTP
jgi:hypothetical protein